jgi:capsule polysaccharide export protein KpsC/LpsZ
MRESELMISVIHFFYDKIIIIIIIVVCRPEENITLYCVCMCEWKRETMEKYVPHKEHENKCGLRLV